MQDIQFQVGVDGVKINHKVLEGEELHACWHGKGEPHIAYYWKSANSSELEDQPESQEKLQADIVDAIEELTIEDMD